MIKFFSQAAVSTATIIAIATPLIGVKPANAQYTTVCESINYQPATCQIDTRGGVVLEQEYSSTICAGNWGFGDGFVWVENGCRARFRTAAGYSPGYGSGQPYPTQGCPNYCPEDGYNQYDNDNY